MRGKGRSQGTAIFRPAGRIPVQRNTLKMSRHPAERSQKPHPGERVLLEPLERLCRYINRMTEQMARKHTPTVEELSKFTEAVKRLRKLIKFAVPPGPELSREALGIGARLIAELVSSEEARKAYYAAGDYPRGRPVVRRQVAAAALEAKQDSPQLSRLELVQRFCPCGQTEHSQQCVNRLRRDVQRLNALIRQILTEYPA